MFSAASDFYLWHTVTLLLYVSHSVCMFNLLGPLRAPLTGWSTHAEELSLTRQAVLCNLACTHLLLQDWASASSASQVSDHSLANANSHNKGTTQAFWIQPVSCTVVSDDLDGFYPCTYRPDSDRSCPGTRRMGAGRLPALTTLMVDPQLRLWFLLLLL